MNNNNNIIIIIIFHLDYIIMHKLTNRKEMNNALYSQLKPL